MMRNLFLATIAGLLAACTWVETKPGAENVEVLEQARVAKCERLGKTRVQVLESFAGLDRHDKEIAEDLAQLARNNAVEMGGDTVSPLTPVEQGERQFGIYRCIDAGDDSGRDDTATDEGDSEDGVTTQPYRDR